MEVHIQVCHAKWYQKPIPHSFLVVPSLPCPPLVLRRDARIQVVRQNWKFKPTYATSGSCALVGIIQGSVLYVAGVGDSKAVLATSEPGTGEERRGGEGEGRGGEGVWLRAIELSEEHSASSEESRQEVLDRCPEDPGILVEKKGAWRIKGFIEVSTGALQPLERIKFTQIWTGALQPQERVRAFVEVGTRALQPCSAL